MSETALLFLFVYCAGLMLALFVRPMFGLYTYIAVFYLHPPSRWWGAALPDIRWSLVAAVVTLIALLWHGTENSERDPWYRSRVIVLLLAYTVWMWIQMPWVESTTHTEGVVLFSKYVLLMALIYTIVDSEERLRGFCAAHVAGCAFLGLLVYLAPDAGRLEGVGGPGIDNANTLGMHLTSGLIFAAFLLLIARGWLRWGVLAAIPFILNGVIQTETRGALVGLLLGGLATVYLKPKSIRGAYYSLGALAVLGFLLVANETYLERMGSMTAAVSDDREWDNSASSRVAIAEAQLEMFSDYPLGVGHQGTAHLSRDYLDERWLANSGDRASHNTVLSILVDQGLPGIVIFALIAIWIARSLRRLKRMDATGLPNDYALYRAMLGGAIVAIIGSGMFAQYLKAEVQIWCLALMAVLWDLSQRTETSTAVETKPATAARRIPTARKPYSLR